MSDFIASQDQAFAAAHKTLDDRPGAFVLVAAMDTAAEIAAMLRDPDPIARLELEVSAIGSQEVLVAMGSLIVARAAAGIGQPLSPPKEE